VDGRLSSWGLSWATWSGLIYRNFEIWLKVALGLECFSVWELLMGTWREGSLPADPEGYVEKVLKTGISFHRVPVWGTWRRARLPGTLRGG